MHRATSELCGHGNDMPIVQTRLGSGAQYQWWIGGCWKLKAAVSRIPEGSGSHTDGRALFGR
jgi:hypothetical protein